MESKVNFAKARSCQRRQFQFVHFTKPYWKVTKTRDMAFQALCLKFQLNNRHIFFHTAGSFVFLSFHDKIVFTNFRVYWEIMDIFCRQKKNHFFEKHQALLNLSHVSFSRSIMFFFLRYQMTYFQMRVLLFNSAYQKWES